MANLRSLTIVVENTGRRVPVEEIDASVTAAELLRALAGKINLPEGTNGVIIQKKTYKQLLPAETLAAAGVENGDVLIADFERVAG